MPLGCKVTSFDQNRDPQGNCIFQEGCTCVQADGGARWACAP
jgi:hypothetical protein